MKTIPVRSTVLIKPDEVEKESSGILLPDTAISRMQTAVNTGTIVNVGGQFWQSDYGVEWPGPKPKVGDKVLFDKYAGSAIKIDREDYRLCNDEKILAILEE